MIIATLIVATLIGITAAFRSQESRTTRRGKRRGEANHEMSVLPLPRQLHVVGQGSGNESSSEAMTTATVSVIIPTLNEIGSLTWVLEHLPEWVNEVVLVDGLSTDRTEALGRRLRPNAVVVHQHQRGKGAALRAGFAAATGDIVVMIDADGSTDPREMGRFIDALKDGADFAKGSRHMEGGGSADFTRLRAAGNKSFVLMANMLYGSQFTDLCYGYCAFWRRHLDRLGLTADGFEIETQLVLGAVKAGLEIREVPSFELERRAGTSNLNAAARRDSDPAHDARTRPAPRRRRNPFHPAESSSSGLAHRSPSRSWRAQERRPSDQGSVARRLRRDGTARRRRVASSGWHRGGLARGLLSTRDVGCEPRSVIVRVADGGRCREVWTDRPPVPRSTPALSRSPARRALAWRSPSSERSAGSRRCSARAGRRDRRLRSLQAPA